MHTDIENALKVLQEGGVILYPTDTIWGLGCDAGNADAVKRIYDIKKRTDNKSMLLLVDNENRIISYVNEVPDIAWQLIEVADKPLTIIYPGAKNIAANLIADDGSVGIRVAKDEFCQKLISRFKKPIVSTSANVSGEPTPSNFIEINTDLEKTVDYVVKYRQDEINKATPSQIIKIKKGGIIKVIRE